jgi:hypothetical protein
VSREANRLRTTIIRSVGQGFLDALGCLRDSDDTIHHSFNCRGCIFGLSFAHKEQGMPCCFVHFVLSGQELN